MDTNSDSYATRTLDFVERISCFDDQKHICNEIERELLWYGLTNVTIKNIPGPSGSLEDGMILNTRPAEYLDHYIENNYIFSDPVVLELFKTTNSYTWNDIRETRKLSKNQKFIMDEGREFGATDGYVVPIHTLTGEVAIFSPCGEAPNLSSRARSALELIGMYSYQALNRAGINKKKEDDQRQPLTPREREVMTWVAAGKTDHEIADILTVSSTTIASHVQNAKKNLDAYKRTYAVVQAIKFGEISI